MSTLYPVINENSLITLNTHFTIFKFVHDTHYYLRRALYVTKSQWQQLKSIQTIAIRITIGMPTFLRNEVLHRQTNTTTIEK